MVGTPDPLNWDCFRFGIIQSADHFTFYASIDHVHVDAMIVGVTLMDFFMMYLRAGGRRWSGGGPGSGQLRKVLREQHRYTSGLTLESPEIRAWTDYAQQRRQFPAIPLSWGSDIPTTSDIVTVSMMDEEQTANFESVCVSAGSRFIGGVFACSAMVERELTGAATYYGLTPKDTRRSTADAMTQGWFTGLIPVTVPIAGRSFGRPPAQRRCRSIPDAILLPSPMTAFSSWRPTCSGRGRTFRW